ncbi:ergothioneine biosynthesis protein EgtB [bacterium SCSIO 12643]|nr:ergothioneine biosynthesis protein EgtB [bacterium SCSIO 12643]
MKNALIERFMNIRLHTVEICQPLQVEDYVAQPIEDVSPPKWHLAHTTWFFETFVLNTVEEYDLFDEQYSFLFNSYYNNIGKRVSRNKRGDITRPGVDEIMEYRSHVNDQMVLFIDNMTPDKFEYWRPIIELGLQHEQQHQELLWTDLKYILGVSPIFPVYASVNPIDNEIEKDDMEFISISEGVYEIGHKSDDFCFDNELGVHKVFLHDFEISDRLVTNAEYLEFIEAGGYEDFNLWHDEGWKWLQENEIDSPLYWRHINGGWFEFTLTGLEEIDPKRAVTHISYYEAWAYAHWKGMRLPTEFEWEIASQKMEWGHRWEWTNSAYLAYPNYKKAEGAIGEYNGKFMINQMVLRGASVATSPNHSRYTYRNFWHAEGQSQFTGIRLAK